ncbi:hypothetical protein KEM52_000966 [Ascosphaera acerosa]|nr:hypothetical protein KEM52_000966 [Ascosphaera acerosa]
MSIVAIGFASPVSEVPAPGRLSWAVDAASAAATCVRPTPLLSTVGRVRAQTLSVRIHWFSILYTVDANSFASLCLLNRRWRTLSDRADIYLHHLRACGVPGPTPPPSTTLPTDDDNGSRLLAQTKRRFLRVCRRNAFDAYCRPKRTTVRIRDVSCLPFSTGSDTGSGSSGIHPHVEAFSTWFSHDAQCLVVTTASVICCIALDRGGPPAVLYELRVTSKPLQVAVTDDGRRLVVALSNDLAIVYDAAAAAVAAGNDAAAPQTVSQVIKLRGAPRALALAPGGGSVLAIAYDRCIEVVALEAGAPGGGGKASASKRTIRCDGVRHMRFANDGLTLVGSSLDPARPAATVIEIPFALEIPEDLTFAEACVHMWTTQIVRPRRLGHYCYASLVHSGPGLFSRHWVVGYDTSLKVFRLSDPELCPAGTVSFVGPGISGIREEPPPQTVPAVNRSGQLLAVGFRDSGIWLYTSPTTSDHPSLPLPSARDSDTAGRSSTGRPPELIQQWRRAKHRTNSQRLKKVLQGPRSLVYGQRLDMGDGDGGGGGSGGGSGVENINLRWVAGAANDSMADRLVVVQRRRISTGASDASRGMQSVLTVLDFR